MAEMKGIKLCGECANYDWKKHKCKIGCNDDSNAQSSFYGDCPLPDVVPTSEEVKRASQAFKFAILESEKRGKILMMEHDQELAKRIFEDIENIITTNYNKHIFGYNDLDDIEHEAIMNYSDDISSDLEELKKKYKVCDGNCQKCDQAIWDRSTSFVGENRIVGCEWKESEDKP